MRVIAYCLYFVVPLVSCGQVIRLRPEKTRACVIFLSASRFSQTRQQRSEPVHAYEHGKDQNRNYTKIVRRSLTNAMQEQHVVSTRHEDEVHYDIYYMYVSMLTVLLLTLTE